ncbi:hypothetical protein EDD29_0048 [Actinocorallia herbida]|uniref:Peptidoglycan recognition protein family domain-containing protein n=1 Tax=Actinocorallia herbida TaxID=58109 RepID=A0A3N1CPB9_9ACTN|nr:hypothetical protein [Actinocorallia herbida]ROO82568.1 hypothetical protein EDD29_0048 [Actinocorallia herbida]
MQLVTRKQWGARTPKAAASYLASTKGVKVHYTGSRVDPKIVDDHDLCAALVRQIQNGHMDGNGWNDIGYSFAVCPHRYVFEGRGLHKLPAANGAGLNSDHYAVLGLVGNSGLTVPPDLMLHGIRDAIDHVRAQGGAGTEVKGHRDGYATDCPGPQLYKWVQDGAPRPKTKEEDVALSDADIAKIADKVAERVWKRDGIIPAADGNPDNAYWTGATTVGYVAKQVRGLAAAVAALPAPVPAAVDEAAIVQGVLAGLSVDAIAERVIASVGESFAEQLLQALALRLGR